jgi:hypothetical protein
MPAATQPQTAASGTAADVSADTSCVLCAGASGYKSSEGRKQHTHLVARHTLPLLLLLLLHACICFRLL